MDKKFTNLIVKAITTISQKLNIPARNVRNPTSPSFLIICQTRVGDTVFSLPAIRALREEFPQSYIGILTNYVGLEIFKHNPDINDIFVLKKGRNMYLSSLSVLKLMRKKHIDTVFVFNAVDRIIWPLCFFTGASQIVGLHGQNKGLDFLLTHNVHLPEGLHAAEWRLKLLEQIGIIKSSAAASIYLSQDEKEQMRQFLCNNGISEKKPLIGFHPGADGLYRCWPAEKFIEAGNILTKRLSAQIVITGGPGERRLGNIIASAIKGAISFAGELSLRDTIALIERMDLFIVGDTGPMHIADALRTPMITLFCPSEPKITGPYHAEKAIIVKKTMPCNPCRLTNCDNNFCMGQITVEEVVDYAKRFIM